ncbi:MAG: SDR family NAD(P)-dependent oxidoreductase [Mycobacteriaceae bacterium]
MLNDSPMNQFSLSGKVAVITGASSGLGVGFARAFVAAGANVVLAARRIEKLEELAQELNAETQRAIVHKCDVTDSDDCAAVVAKTVAEFGAVNILINNAGTGTAVPALRETPEEFRAVVDVNLMGSYWMAQECARVMPLGSSIVNIASVLGLMKSYAPQAAYAASKAGVIGLTRDLAQQWGERKGIRVNAIAPGYFVSELTGQIPQDQITAFMDRTAILKRFGEQRELDAAVIFLASDAASFITGTTLVVDGGMSCR